MLRWRLKHYKNLSTAARAYAKGMPNPIEGAPPPFPGCEYWLGVFTDLSRARPVYGMGTVGGIPPTWIDAELDRRRYDPWMRRFMYRLLTMLDIEYVDWATSQKPTPQSSEPPKLDHGPSKTIGHTR